MSIENKVSIDFSYVTHFEFYIIKSIGNCHLSQEIHAYFMQIIKHLNRFNQKKKRKKSCALNQIVWQVKEAQVCFLDHLNTYHCHINCLNRKFDTHNHSIYGWAVLFFDPIWPTLIMLMISLNKYYMITWISNF